MATTAPVRIRHRPTETEAMLVTEENVKLVADWCGGMVVTDFPKLDRCVSLRTANGPVRAYVGNWVIRDTEGTFYPCVPLVFDAAYVLCPEESPASAPVSG